MQITTLSLFRVSAYIDTDTVINTFTATKYLYFSQAEDSGVSKSGFYNNMLTDQYSSERMISDTTFGTE